MKKMLLSLFGALMISTSLWACNHGDRFLILPAINEYLYR